MQCDICGKDTRLFRTKVEGSLLNLCKSCSEHGKVVGEVKTEVKKKPGKKIETSIGSNMPEFIENIVDDYSVIVRKAREEKGWKQKDLSDKMAERESVISKVESGGLKPSLKLARKFERVLGVKLIVQEEVKNIKPEKLKSSALTIGDML